MDISQTIEADSSQINADDLTGSPRTVTITGVSKGTADQPVNIELAEFPGRAYRPCKSMRRVLVFAWGKEASEYIGRRMTLYNDPNVKWGGQSVGGVRIKALSHIDKRLEIPLTVTRGRRAPFTVEPLREPEPANTQVAPITDEDAADFAQAIEIADLDQLKVLALELKSCNLSTHRKTLLEAWAARKEELTSGGDA